MKHPPNRTDRLAILRIVAIYAFFSGLWIYLSDHVVEFLIRDPASIVHFSIFKGFLFVILTSCLLYQLISRYIRATRETGQALRESESRMNKAEEIAHLGSWELDVVSNTLTWSDEVYRIFGFQPQEFGATYETFLEAVHPDDRQAVDSAYSGSLREGRDAYEIEHRVVRKSTGEIRYVHEKCEHMRDETGRVIRSLGMVHDITERKVMEEARQQSERRYRLLFENMLNGFAYCKILFDGQGRPDDFVYIDVNSAFTRLTGLDNVIGKKVTEAIPGIKELHPELFDVYYRVALTGRPETFEIEFKPLGIWLFVAVYSTEREYFVAVFDNITERKLSEKALRESEELFRATFNQAAVGIAHTSMDGRWMRVNQKLCEILGYNEEELMGLSVKAITHPDDWETSARHLQLLRDGELKNYSLEKRYLRKNGSTVWVNVTVSLVCDPNGHRFNVGVVEDITARKKIEEEIKQLNEELEERVMERTKELEAEAAMRIEAMNALMEKDRMLIQQSRMAAMGEMLNNIAHQWRQPLNVLGLKIQGIGLSYELGGFSKELLDDNIAKSMDILQHLSQTIDDFRDFSAPDKGKSLFRVDRVVAKTVSIIEDSFAELGIAIEVSATGAPEINGYPNEYGQVLLNILMNAKDALLEHGTTDARITVRSWAEGSRVVVVITDNASGIKEEIMDNIFDAYFTTKELGKGTGIGLFMSKMIIEKNMGGRLTVRNLDRGAEFRIEV